MLPEWLNNPEARSVVTIIGVAGAIAFLLMVWVFAFYW